MTAVAAVAAEARRESLVELGKRWWIPLLSGIAWFILAWIFLSFDVTTVWTVAIFAGIYLIYGGLIELMMAAVTPSWRWLHVILGITFIVGGFLAMVWPDSTFLVLAALISWMVMISGVIDVVTAIMFKSLDDLWWITLLVGFLEIAVGLWAIGYPGRSITLLVVWLAAIAITRGIVNIVLALQVHKLKSLGEQA
jgi:uncharacterized membrane protein HdeD (DUF308 family)